MRIAAANKPTKPASPRPWINATKLFRTSPKNQVSPKTTPATTPRPTTPTNMLVKLLTRSPIILIALSIISPYGLHGYSHYKTIKRNYGQEKRMKKLAKFDI